MEEKGWEYQKVVASLKGEALPAMVVNLAHLDANTRRIAAIAAAAGKRLRVASKSVRVPQLLRRIMEIGGEHFQGLMCFSAAEACYLASQGFDDLLIAYPTLQDADLTALWNATQAGTQITLMVDSLVHVAHLDAFWAEKATLASQPSQPLRICIDVDMSYKPFGLHLGVQRSSIRSLSDFVAVSHAIEASPQLQLEGVMGYEAQIAGMGDATPFTAWMNPFKRLLKRLSRTDVAKQREEVARWLAQEKRTPRFFNGGGTGSLTSTTKEPWLTEVTAGSGFLQSHLFDYYTTNENIPAFCFGLQVTRTPQPGLITCQSGGFIASGEIGPDKAPLPFLPVGLTTLSREGFGEVQTPLVVPTSTTIAPGDIVFFRPAKAGEIAEHFGEYLLVEGDRIVGRAPTYRGLGLCFH